MIEKKVYSSWAFGKNESEKAKINREIYEEIKNKATVKFEKYGYNHNVYKIVDNPENLSNDELALICDDGNLCFGYRMKNGMIVISTD